MIRHLLLDTHALLWWLDDNPKLSKKARNAIQDSKNLVFISAAVVWEIMIKSAIGKLEIPDDFPEVLNTQSFLQLSITVEHAIEVRNLPHIHQDPFDRILIAQARVERLTFVTKDQNPKKYDVPILPA